jgi:hypothetical protein
MTGIWRICGWRSALGHTGEVTRNVQVPRGTKGPDGKKLTRDRMFEVTTVEQIPYTLFELLIDC